MDLAEFNPGPVYTGFGDLHFELRKFDLRAIVWSESYFSDSHKGGLNAMFYILNNSEKEWHKFSFAVSSVSFYLAKNLPVKTLEEYTGLINLEPSKSIARLWESIKEILEKSFPENKKTELTGGELFNKSLDSEEPKDTNWAAVYADFYRYGGMTIKQFYSLTLKQVQSIYSEINEARQREKIELMRFDCSIRGIKKQNWPKMPAKKENTEISNDEIKRRQEQHAKLFGE